MLTCRHYLPNKQNGVALITAILIVALATIASAAMFTKQQLNTRRTENLVHSDQAYMYTLGAEQWASQALLQDKDMNVDHSSEIWATPLPPMPVDGGSIAGVIIDASSGFPLNNLVDKAGASQKYYVKAFTHLAIELFENGDSVGNLVTDWVDSNSDVRTVGGMGAEDVDYESLPHRPYRAANGYISSISELQLILRKSEDPENVKNDYATLFPSKGPALVNALPFGAKININSAPHVILTSLLMAVDDMDLQLAKSIVEEVTKDRGEKPIENLNDFKSELDTQLKAKLQNNASGSGGGTAGLRPEHTKAIKAVNDMLSVGSKYFLVQSTGKIGRIELYLHSLVKRDNNKVITLRRGLGTL